MARWNWRAVTPAVMAVALAILGAFSAPTARAAVLVEPAALQAWADSYYGRAIGEHRAAGITVSVVEDGKLIFAKGYGYADLGKGTPVDPAATGFDIGSITKTFVATAIFQQIERGKIASLDDPANKYLKRIQLPGKRGARITIRELLTHRAGFEDSSFAWGARPKSLPLSGAELKRYVPQIVLEPGGPTNYSNAGFSILGILLEDVSGERIDKYLQKNILDPLGMAHTSMAYERFPPNQVQNYQFTKDGAPVPDPVPLPNPFVAPAGLIVSTATDMALYMQAQMAEGDGPNPILGKALFQQLHQVQHSNAPVSIALAHAFWVLHLGDLTTLEHGGGTPTCQSLMLMVPKQHLAIFVSALQGGLAPGQSYSSAELKSGSGAVQRPIGGLELRESFVERFLTPETIKPGGAAIRDLSALVGTYWLQRRPFTTLEILGQAFDSGNVAEISLSPDGRLMFDGHGPYRDIGNGVFESPTGRDLWSNPYKIDRHEPAYIAFSFDPSGKVTYLSPGLTDTAWVPVSPIANPHILLIAAMVLGAIVVSGGLMFLWPHRSGVLALANWAAAGAALAILAIPALMFAGFSTRDSLLMQWTNGYAARFWGLIVAANGAAVLGVAMAGICAWAWARPAVRAGQTPRTVHLSAVVVAALCMIYIFDAFNLIGVHIPR